jgi:hypothetical protein
MTAPDFAAIEEQMRAARAELGDVMEEASRELIRYRRENQPTEQERQALQDAALRGELGDDMRRLARYVDNGEDSWDAIFSGRSPNRDLLQGHLERMITQHREAIVQAFEDDPDFDPSEPPEEGR